MYLKEGAGFVSLATLDTSNPKAKPQELVKLHLQDVSIRWIRQDRVILTEKSSASAMSSVWSYDIKSKKFSLLSDGLGTESVWSGTSTDTGLVFEATKSKRGGILSLVGGTGNTLTYLKLATLPSKCSFSSEVDRSPAATLQTPTSTTSASSTPSAPKTVNVLYCAVPRDRARFLRAALPDDYLKKSLFTADDVYKIDLTQGNTLPIFDDKSQLFDASSLKVFNQNLFFINRLDNKIYAVSLKSS